MMIKKIAVLEDRPWVLWGFVKKIKEMGIEEVIIIYYHSPKNYEQSNDDSIQKECDEQKVKLIHIEDLKFDEKMNELYSDGEMLFFFDLDIGDRSSYFEERINVRYANEKWEKGDRRIWFYTTSGPYNVDQINRKFEDHCIPVIDFDQPNNILVFDYKFIKKRVLKKE